MRNGNVWHRGVANHGDEHRPMISVGYSVASRSDGFSLALLLPVANTSTPHHPVQ